MLTRTKRIICKYILFLKSQSLLGSTRSIRNHRSIIIYILKYIYYKNVFYYYYSKDILIIYCEYF